MNTNKQIRKDNNTWTSQDELTVQSIAFGVPKMQKINYVPEQLDENNN